MIRLAYNGVHVPEKHGEDRMRLLTTRRKARTELKDRRCWENNKSNGSTTLYLSCGCAWRGGGVSAHRVTGKHKQVIQLPTTLFSGASLATTIPGAAPSSAGWWGWGSGGAARAWQGACLRPLSSLVPPPARRLAFDRSPRSHPWGGPWRGGPRWPSLPQIHVSSSKKNFRTRWVNGLILLRLLRTPQRSRTWRGAEQDIYDWRPGIRNGRRHNWNDANAALFHSESPAFAGADRNV
jgi:hypothetical protein